MHFKLIKKEQIVNLIKKKRIARNLNLDLYFSNIKIEDSADVYELFGENDFIQSIDSQWIILNYSKIVKQISINTSIVYSDLTDYFNDEIPIGEFHSKFKNIKKLVVNNSNVTDEDQFLKFLKGAKVLKELAFENTLFNQAFFNQLKSNLSNKSELEKLKIEQQNQELITDLNFLKQLDFKDL